MEVEAAGAASGEAAAPSPPPAPPLAPSPPPLPEVEEARARLVKALHGTLLQSHINAPRAQATAVDALLAMVQARASLSWRGPVASVALAWRASVYRLAVARAHVLSGPTRACAEAARA